MLFIFKASFDKANRFGQLIRGPGLDAGLGDPSDVRSALGVPVLTDVHDDTLLAEVAAVVDVRQHEFPVPADEFHRHDLLRETPGHTQRRASS